MSIVIWLTIVATILLVGLNVWLIWVFSVGINRSIQMIAVELIVAVIASVVAGFWLDSWAMVFCGLVAVFVGWLILAFLWLLVMIGVSTDDYYDEVA